MSRNNGRNLVTKGVTKFIHSITITSQVGSLAVNDSLSTYLTAMASIHRLYRFTKMVITCFPDSALPASEVTGCMFAPTGLSTAPTAQTDLEGPYMTAFAGDLTVPMRFTVPEEAMITDHRWFVTENDATEVSAERIGTLFAASSSSTAHAIRLLMEIHYEFKFPLDSVVIGTLLDRIKLKQIEEEKEEDKPTCKCGDC